MKIEMEENKDPLITHLIQTGREITIDLFPNFQPRLPFWQWSFFDPETDPVRNSATV